MRKDLKAKSQAHFDARAAHYDDDPSFKHPRACQPFVLDAIATLPPFARVLDLGCGTGTLLEALHEQYPNAVLSGLDLSQPMIECAHDRLGDTAALLQGDAEAMPYADNSFDLICCTESFHHYPDPQQALSEIARVLDSGGHFLLCDMLVPEGLRQLLNITMPRFSSGGDVHAYGRRELVQLFADIGLREVSWRAITVPAHTFISISRTE